MPRRSRGRGGERGRAPIALLTDFGYRDHYAGAMKGVIASIAPAAQVIDLTHGVPAQSVAAGALLLLKSWRYFPAQTIFVAVVDPGVGTARRPLAIETRAGARFVGPDNGLLWPAAAEAGVTHAVELRSERHRLAPVSATFHGRDIFAPAAAHLWRGVALKALGPRLSAIERLELGEVREQAGTLRGEVVYVDGFGNLVSNIDRAAFEAFAARFPARSLWVRMRCGVRIRICNAYGEARRGGSLALFGSFDMLEIAVRGGSASERFGAGRGTPIVIHASR